MVNHNLNSFKKEQQISVRVDIFNKDSTPAVNSVCKLLIRLALEQKHY